MAILGDATRQQITNGLMRYWSSLFEVVSNLTKSDLRATINATDDWINDNQSAYNSSLPVVAQNNLTADQKTLLFCSVALARVSTAFLRKIFGEVE